MFCVQCGAAAETTAKFCWSCGAKISRSAGDRPDPNRSDGGAQAKRAAQAARAAKYEAIEKPPNHPYPPSPQAQATTEALPIPKIDEAKARTLLRVVGWLLTIYFAAGIGILLTAHTGSESAVVWCLIICLISAICFLDRLGRLASGLGRSAIYYAGGTLLASFLIGPFASLIAFGAIRTRVNQAFPKKGVSAPA
jgi:hypothetical protein